MNDWLENEERLQLAPLPRRGGVSSSTHRATGIGLDEALMLASPLSQPDNDWRYWFERAYKAWLARQDQIALFDAWLP